MSGESYDYDGIERRLRAVSGLVREVLPDLVGWFDEYVDVGEYGLAVEIVAERLTVDMPGLPAVELAGALLAEAELMELPDETRKPLESVVRGEAP